MNAAISKQKVLHGLNQVTQAQGILIPVKWEQNINSSFLSQTRDGLYFPASPLGLPDGMCQNLSVVCFSGFDHIPQFSMEEATSLDSGSGRQTPVLLKFTSLRQKQIWDDVFSEKWSTLLNMSLM